jgi:ElaB/YqjD/DUF883 family membrane-anchored ribosome-binding protein
LELKKMPEKSKTRVDDLEETLNDVRDLAERSMDDLEKLIRKRPLESAALILMAGIVLGVLWGTSARRD